MLTLGESFLTTVARDPNALAIVDGDVRYTYREWLPQICSLANNLRKLGLAPHDRIVGLLQNRWETATL